MARSHFARSKSHRKNFLKIQKEERKKGRKREKEIKKEIGRHRALVRREKKLHVREGTSQLLVAYPEG